MQYFNSAQLRALNASLTRLDLVLNTKLDFLTKYGLIYKMPKRLLNRNIREYEKNLKAIRQLKTIKTI